MRLTTTTNVSVDGVMQGLGGPDEDRSGGFDRGGWAIPLLDTEAGDYLNEVYGSGALVRWLLANDLVDQLDLLTYPVIVGQGTRLFPDTGPDTALELVTSRTTSRGITIQTYRPAGRPEYATSTADPNT